MSGKLCIGAPANNIGAGRLSQSKAYCEGMLYRTTGNAITADLSGNPHPVGSPDSVSWIAGWNFADDQSGSALGSSGTCCAVYTDLVVP